MKTVFALGSGLSLLLSLASAQNYDATVCGKERFGEFSDPQVCESFPDSCLRNVLDSVFEVVDMMVATPCWTCSTDRRATRDTDLPNAWNEKSPDDGFVCMSIDNSTPAFDATWMWPENIADVHSYPYVRLNDDALPVRLSHIESMRLKSDWIMTLGSPRSPPRDFSSSTWAENKEELDDEGVTANAAWDFFLDGNRTRTYNPVDSAIEVMIWLGRVGHARPLEGDGVVTTITLGDHELYVFTSFGFAPIPVPLLGTCLGWRWSN